MRPSPAPVLPAPRSTVHPTRPSLSRVVRSAAGALLLAACGTSDAAEPASAPAWSEPGALPARLTSPQRAHPRLAGAHAEAGGRVHAVFLDAPQGSTRPDQVLYSRLDGGRWTEPEALVDAAGPVALPQVVVDGDGLVHVVWWSAPPAGLPRAVVHRQWDGAAWSAPDTLYHEPSPNGVPHPTLAVRTDARGHLQVVHARASGGFAHLTLPPRGRAAAELGTEGGYLRWDDGPGGGSAVAFVAARVSPLRRAANNDVWTQLRRGDGWSEPIPVHVSDGWSYEPVLWTGRTGMRHAVWLEGAEESRPDRVLHATSPDGIRWSPPADITPAVPGGDFQAPRLAEDAAGRLRLVVTRNEGSIGRPRHYEMLLEDGRWSAPRPRFADPGHSRSPLAMTADASGTLHALWRDLHGTYRHATSPPQD